MLIAKSNVLGEGRVSLASSKPNGYAFLSKFLTSAVRGQRVGKNKLLQALFIQLFFDSLHERASVFFAPVRAKLIRKTDSFDVPASPSADLRGWH
jgi:hypothetical protein